MIEIDKLDFLYKHLTKLGVDDLSLERLYLEYAGAGVANLQDFKKYIYSKYAETVGEEVDEDFIEEMIPYYRDLKKLKSANKQDLKKMLNEYKTTHDKKVREKIINAKLRDVLFQAYLYKLKYKDEDVMDIVQICNMGLIEAIEKYDEKSRVAFDDYIEFWINMEIEKCFTKENK